MTQRPLTNAAKLAMYSQESPEAFIILLTIDHPTFTAPIRVASDPFELLPDAGVRGVVSRGNEFIFMPFILELPQEDDTGAYRATLSVDNVTREIVAAVRTANSAISVAIEIVMSSSVNDVEVSVPDFKLEKVNYDALTVSGELSIEYYELEPFPYRRFTPSDFPGLF